MLSSKRNLVALLAGLVLAGIAAGAASHTIRYAEPIELVRVETMSSTDYLTVGRYASVNDALADVGSGGSLPAGSSSNRYQIRIPPGEFDLGGSPIVMEEYVDIVGSGQDSTILTCACGSTTEPVDGGTSATLRGADNASLRELTVINSGGSVYSTAIHNYAAAPDLTNVTAKASGGSGGNYGVFNRIESSPTMTGVSASATGGEFSYGIYNYINSSPVMFHVSASASNGATENYGIYNTSSAPDLTSVRVSAIGGFVSWGVYNYSSPARMNDVSVVADCPGSSIAVYNDSSGVVMSNVTASAEGLNSQNIAVWNAGGAPTMLNVTASADGDYVNYGVLNVGTAYPHTMTNVTASATNGMTNYGVYNDGSSPIMTNIIVNSMNGLGNYGVYNTASFPTMNDMWITVLDGSDRDYGVYNYSSSPSMSNVTVIALGGDEDYAMHNEGTTYTLNINRSSFRGDEFSISSDTAYVINIGASLLDGAIDKGGGTWTCAETYDGWYGAYDATCSGGGAALPPAPSDGGPVEPPALPSPGE